MDVSIVLGVRCGCQMVVCLALGVCCECQDGCVHSSEFAL